MSKLCSVTLPLFPCPCRCLCKRAHKVAWLLVRFGCFEAIVDENGIGMNPSDMTGAEITDDVDQKIMLTSIRKERLGVRWKWVEDRAFEAFGGTEMKQQGKPPSCRFARSPICEVCWNHINSYIVKMDSELEAHQTNSRTTYAWSQSNKDDADTAQGALVRADERIPA